jgi:hypothetical protein
MATVRGIKAYKQLMAKRADNLRRAQGRSASQAATFIQATAIKLAPMKTGETIANIRKRKLKSRGHYQVSSGVMPKGRTGFLQNFWANRTAPHRMPRMYWNRWQKTLYGDGSHRTTGQPGFFHLAALRGRQKFRNLAIKETRKAFRVNV